MEVLSPAAFKSQKRRALPLQQGFNDVVLSTEDRSTNARAVIQSHTPEQPLHALKRFVVHRQVPTRHKLDDRVRSEHAHWQIARASAGFCRRINVIEFVSRRAAMRD